MRFSDEEDRGNDHFGFRIAGPATVTSRYNSWKDSYFSPSDSNTGITDDADGDGLANFLEYAFLGNPALASTGSNFPVLSIDPDNGSPKLQFTRVDALGDAAFSYEISTDLTTWTTVVEGSEFSKTVTDHGDGTETVDITFLNNDPKFLRVVVTLD